MTDELTAQVILQSPGPSDEPVTAANIASRRANEQTLQHARSKLEGLGVRVVQAGPISLTITADKKVFERVFSTRVEKRSYDVLSSKGVTVSARHYYQLVQPIDIPAELRFLVTDVVLPTPPEVFG